MRKIFKIILISLLCILVLIQFIRPKKNISSVLSTNDISTKYPVPDNVKKILQVACNDCHSNNTRYPWYAEIQPVAWWLDGHIEEGKRSLNFSDFAKYRIRKQFRKLEEINELVKKDEMPLASYTWIHKDARLTSEEKQTIAEWTAALQDSIRAHYPSDSLLKK